MDKLLETIRRNEESDPDFYADPKAPPARATFNSLQALRRGRPRLRPSDDSGLSSGGSVPHRTGLRHFTPRGNSFQEQRHNILRALEVGAITIDEAREAMGRIAGPEVKATFQAGTEELCVLCGKVGPVHTHYDRYGDRIEGQ